MRITFQDGNAMKLGPIKFVWLKRLEVPNPHILCGDK
jgi:hypothetical protein